MKLSIALLLVLTFTLMGCSSNPSHYTAKVTDPNREVDRILARYEMMRTAGESCHNEASHQSDWADCEGLLRRLSQLYSTFPANERVKFAAALLSYHAGKREQAGFLLDQILVNERPRPEAAILRARIALEEGNSRRARSLLESQIRQNPMHPSLHEIMAATHFADQEPSQAFRALALAERLGAPPWRVAYHRGLMFETAGNAPAACEQYVTAFSLKPEFVAPHGRLIALEHDPVCHDLGLFLEGRL
ncbi:tetratricopeptide repeat protein [Marinobacter fonticola]|uniref:tetratricopeptide repeat protein n=1 Tax=Marinobacter fonticola TaxID=2603215 RepID=UPI0011E71667|nr:hypothetical protein [Marinobacter fonticola]